MTMAILTSATGLGAGDIDPSQAFVDLVVIADDTALGLDPTVGGIQPVSYTQTRAGAPQDRLDDLVNSRFLPDYGSGPQSVAIVIVPVRATFVLADGTPLGPSFSTSGVVLPPSNSGLAGAGLNPTRNCLVIYDTQQNICVARSGTGGSLDLPITNAGVLYHEFSHALRIVNNTLLALGSTCNPSSPEERAAITDENDLRRQLAERAGQTPFLRDPGIHCGNVCGTGSGGGCCIIASLTSGSPISPQVQQLRAIRDQFVRRTEVGFAFFDRLFHDYYAFSPQVCTMIAGDPRLGTAILDGYVDPLLSFWKLMIARAFEDADGEQLAGRLRRQHEGAGVAAAALAALDRTEVYWNLDEAAEVEAPRELLALLRELAWTSNHVHWALVEPVRIYRDALAALVWGASDRTIGAILDRAIDHWAPEFPLDPVWGMLGRTEVERELDLWELQLIRSTTGRRRLRERLIGRFPGVTAIRPLAAEQAKECHD